MIFVPGALLAPCKLDIISLRAGLTFLSNLISLYSSIDTCPPFPLHLQQLTYLRLAHLYTFVPVITLPKSSPLIVVLDSLFPTVPSSSTTFSRESSLTTAAGFSARAVWEEPICHDFRILELSFVSAPRSKQVQRNSFRLSKLQDDGCY